jgi:hypothetical protein
VRPTAPPAAQTQPDFAVRDRWSRETKVELLQIKTQGEKRELSIRAIAILPFLCGPRELWLTGYPLRGKTIQPLRRLARLDLSQWNPDMWQ